MFHYESASLIDTVCCFQNMTYENGRKKKGEGRKRGKKKGRGWKMHREGKVLLIVLGPKATGIP